MAHVTQSKPYPDLGFQVKVPKSFQGVPLSLAGSRRLQIQIKATEKKRFAPPPDGWWEQIRPSRGQMGVQANSEPQMERYQHSHASWLILLSSSCKQMKLGLVGVKAFICLHEQERRINQHASEC
jgi:hypothetical protein